MQHSKGRETSPSITIVIIDIIHVIYRVVYGFAIDIFTFDLDPCQRSSQGHMHISIANISSMVTDWVKYY